MAIGSSINAGLNRPDYSGIMQGAQSSANSRMQGAQAMAQGYAALGQGIGQGIQQYQQKQKEKKQKEEAAKFIKGVLAKSPETATKFNVTRNAEGEFDEKEISAAVNTVGAENIMNFSTMLEKNAKEQAEKDRIRAIESGVASFVNNNGKFPNGVPQELLPIIQAQGEQVIRNIAEQQSKTRATDRSNPAGGGTSTAQSDTEAIIQAQIKAGKLDPNNPVAINAARAEILGAGGREPAARFDSAGTFVKRKDQTQATQVVKDRNTGQFGFVDASGKFKVLDAEEWMPVTTSDSNAFMSEESFSKLSEKVVEEENSMRLLNEYYKDVGGIEQGVGKIGTQVSKMLKTIVTKEALTEEELMLGMSEARQQALLGKLRTSILGPGVLTEIDAQRIINRMGGDVGSIFGNPQLMTAAITEVMEEKQRQYEQMLNVYNAHVVGRYGQTGYAQRKLVPNIANKPQESAEMDIPLPDGMDPEDWKHMTPVQKKLFQ